MTAIISYCITTRAIGLWNGMIVVSRALIRRNGTRENEEKSPIHVHDNEKIANCQRRFEFLSAQ